MNIKKGIVVAMLGGLAFSMTPGTTSAAHIKKTKAPKFEQYFNIGYLTQANQIFEANKDFMSQNIPANFPQPPYTAFIKTTKKSTVFIKQGKKVLYHKKLVNGVGFVKLIGFDYKTPISVYATSKNHKKSVVKSYRLTLYDMNK